MSAQDGIRGAGRVDRVVEQVGRWTAARTTRRSFLGKAGRAAVLVAGGATMATLLADRAEARVCGQSGVAPKCATFDCDETWGWCWYATGCCAGGALKKICDCCAPNTPHPVGYCPSGTRVLCIFESCGADPRLQTKPTEFLDATHPTHLSVGLSQRRYPDGATVVVIGDADDVAHGAVAAALGLVAGGPVLLTGQGGLHSAVDQEMRRLGAEFAVVAGPRLSEGIDRALSGRGLGVERVGGSGGGVAAFSVAAAVWSRGRTGSRRAVVVMDGVRGAALGPAAALAHATRMPLLLGDPDAVRAGTDDPRPLRRTYVVTDDERDAERFPGGRAITGGGATGIAAAVGAVFAGLRPPGDHPVLLAARGDTSAAVGLACAPAPVLVHAPSSLDGARAWVLAQRDWLERGYVAGTRQAFGDQALSDLQALLNEFETHLLTGRAGQGLPVIPQPVSERPIGKARR